MALGKGIPVINGFDLNSKLPLDSRTVVDTLEEMNKLVTNESVGDGQLCYCKADKKLYVLKDNVWSEVGGSGGGKVGIVKLDETQYNAFHSGEDFSLTDEQYDIIKTNDTIIFSYTKLDEGQDHTLKYSLTKNVLTESYGENPEIYYTLLLITCQVCITRLLIISTHCALRLNIS